jgi:F-type H+-transporting ATPase subunit epsilon
MPEDNNFKLKIIAPDRIFLEEDVDFVEFTTTEGQMGVYKNHIPLTAVIMPGVVRIHKDGKIKEAALHSGFVTVLQEAVTIMAEIVEWPEEIDKN